MFPVSVPLDAESIGAMKLFLLRNLPAVTSGHRAEALARAFGFNTYAAMLAADAPTRAPTSRPFVDFLSQRDAVVPPIWPHRAAAHAAILAVLKRMPRLCAGGIYDGPKRLLGERRRETEQEYDVQLAKLRNDCLSPDSADQFLLSSAFLQRLEPIATPRMDSYCLKHFAEDYEFVHPEVGKLGPHYVSNGILIAAAVHRGFRFKPASPGWDASPNLLIGASRRSVRAMEQHCGRRRLA